MNAGQLQSLKDLIEFLKQQEVGEFELEQEDLKVRLRFAGQGSSAENMDIANAICCSRRQARLRLPLRERLRRQFPRCRPTTRLLPFPAQVKRRACTSSNLPLSEHFMKLPRRVQNPSSKLAIRWKLAR